MTDALVVSHLDRLSRSVLDFADILQEAKKKEWNLVVLDLNLSSPQGEFVAHILAAVAQLERRLISDCIRVALAAASAEGVRTGPVRVAQRRPIRTHEQNRRAGSGAARLVVSAPRHGRRQPGVRSRA